MADTVIENLITRLSFKFDDGKLKEFDKFLGSAVKGLTAVAAGATAAATAIFLFTKKVAESNDETGKLARTIGVGVQSLQELGFVAELNGASIDSMNSSLSNVARIASETSRGIGAGVEAFGILGVSVTESSGRVKEADVLLNEISDSIARLGTQAERLEFAQKLGISPDLLLTIQQGSEAIKRQREEARALGFIFDEEAARAAEEFNDAMLKLKRIFSTTTLFTGLMKQITPVVDRFVEWFKINREIIQQKLNVFMEKVVAAARGVFNVVLRVAGSVLSLVKAMGGWKNSIIAVTALLLTMNASALLMPILAIAAGAGVLLILEDIIKFAEGGDSAIGNLAEKFPVLDKALRGVLAMLGIIRDGWVLIFTEGDAALEGFLLLVKDIGRSIDKHISGPLDRVVKILRGIAGFTLKDLISLPAKGFEALTNAKTKEARAANTFKDLISLAARAFGILPGENAGSPQIHQQRANTLNQVIRRGTTNNTTNNSPRINITINGGDTDKVKKVVTDVLSEQYRSAQTNLESQVNF